MKKGFCLFIAVLLLSACAPFEHAYYVDREFGRDSQESWDAQVLYPDYRHTDKAPEDLAGITAEEIMSVRNKMFAEKPSKSKIIEFGMGGSE